MCKKKIRNCRGQTGLDNLTALNCGHENLGDVKTGSAVGQGGEARR